MTYAENTSVPVERSKAEIETTLQRYGACEFVSGWDTDKALIGFRCRDKFVRFELPLPKRDDKRFTHTPSRGTPRRADEAYRAWEQACRQKWRALALCIKAKLEAVESGITTFEDEFLAHIVMPDGQTIGRWMVPQIEKMVESKQMPRLLPGLTG